MESSGYITLTRQLGLMREMQVVANNIANSSTTGFRREGMIFSEYVSRSGDGESISLAQGAARLIDRSEGELNRTGSSLDFAIRGDGFFLVQTPGGPRLTRAGSFTLSGDGVLRNPDGHALLDAGASPVAVGPGAGAIRLGDDGTLSVDGVAVARILAWLPEDPLKLRHEGGTLFEGGNPAPAEGAVFVQGAVEASNVNPIAEMARMIEVQRAYEFGQSFLQREDERQRAMIRTMGDVR